MRNYFKKRIVADEQKIDIASKRHSVLDKVIKKLIFVLPVIVIASLAVFTPTHMVHASVIGNAFMSIAYFLIAKICFFISWIISWICEIIIGAQAWAIGIILNISSGIFNTPIVQSGFSISLAVANLGFVFGIIVIAIATILQNQTYGIKQTLWKLVLMAILVNFGLVIMGSIFNFADQFTNYFLSCTTGTCGGTVSVATTDNNFAIALAGAFNPQQFTQATPSSTVGMDENTSSLLIPIVALVFTVFALVAIIITLGTFCIMLIIRYVYIAILAVLLPFAWMLWVFPSTKSNFDKWWGAFIKWTIFAPVFLFFTWLGIITAHSLALTSGPQSFSNITPGNGGSTIVSGIGPLVGNILNAIVLIGLLVGGMFAANELSITGAKEAIGAMKGAAKGFGTWAYKKSDRGLSRVGARIAAPPVRRNPTTGALYTPNTRFNRWRGQMSVNLENHANSPQMQTAGLFGSIWNGAKRGSGLFRQKVWRCNAPGCGATFPRKPGGTCPNCHSTPAVSAWTQV